MSLLFNMLSRLVIALLPGSKRLLISWLQSPSEAIDISPSNLDSSLCFIQPGILHDVLCIFEEGNVNPLQYSCLENSMDRGAWQAAVHRVTKSGI